MYSYYSKTRWPSSLTSYYSRILNYLDNGKIHKKSGQTFVRIKD